MIFVCQFSNLIRILRYRYIHISMNVTIYSQKKWEEMMSDEKMTQRVKRKFKLNQLILNWLIVECHINAVKSFSKDLGLNLDVYINDGEQVLEDDLNEDLDDIELIGDFDNLGENDDDFFKSGDGFVRDELMINNLKTMRIRHEIKMSILKGNILQSFELINLNFPNLFDKNHLIYFKLLHMHLIEMIREHVILKLQRDVSEEEERAFLDQVMGFVKLKLSSLKILSNKIFIKELELTMVLLCYTDELTKLYHKDNTKVKIPLKLRKLFDKSQRSTMAKLINKSILLDINNDDDINLVRYQEDQEDQDLLSRFNESDNNKLSSLIKLWIWSENELAQHDVIFPGINLDL